MLEVTDIIRIKLEHIEKDLILTIDAKSNDTLFISHDANENGEAENQLVEGFSYDYELSSPEYQLEKSNIIQPHSRKDNIGIISPNIYVGTLSIPLIHKKKQVDEINLEVRSIKTNYRNDYRDMLEFITERCTDLIMQSSSPVNQNFETDFENDYSTLYQKFVFVKSVISNSEFVESIHRITSSPVTKWRETSEHKDIRSVRRFRNSSLKQIANGNNRTILPKNHHFRNLGLTSLPKQINYSRKLDTIDTPENRFIKYALETFLKFVSNITAKAKEKSRLHTESLLLENELGSFLNHNIFKELSTLQTLPLNSPILQRKEGYREIYRVWLMFDLAAKLIWKGGEDVYKGGKKNIAKLYEYWLFFKLLDLLKSIFEIEPEEFSKLLSPTKDGLHLNLKEGSETALKGIYRAKSRDLNIQFNYNKTFNGRKQHPYSGTWTNDMNPDYTLSFWPHGISDVDAERQELITHIHFDAKYKIDNLSSLIKSESDTRAEVLLNRAGKYKNTDLIKMHAYKDAIHRTGGAYVLYPGDISLNRKGFHEIIPGLGAFPVRPSKTDDGTSDLRKFIIELVDHFLHRSSQREKIAYQRFDIYKNLPSAEERINVQWPEALGPRRHLIPATTSVVVGSYKESVKDWIENEGIYNADIKDDFNIGINEVNAKFAILYPEKDIKNARIYEIASQGTKIYSKQKLVGAGYPIQPVSDYYLIFNVMESSDPKLKETSWNLSLLKDYEENLKDGKPFTITLVEAINVMNYN